MVYINKNPKPPSTIWLKLKAKNKAVVNVAPEFQKKLRTSIIKEKFKDIGFRFANETHHLVLEISYNDKTQQMTFILRRSLQVSEL